MQALQAWIRTAARHDARLYDRVAGGRTAAWNRVMIGLTRSGDARVYVGVALLGAAVGSDVGAAAVAGSAAACAASAVGYVLKRAVARPRPTLRSEARAALLRHPDAYSFPSSHTAAAVAAALVLGAALGPAALAPLLAWA
ncbi:MAG TPA: phosphatase PAP2 family protein, partial [Planctomycetota bacterium]|nr:phosphatase PAP2 family protein [Planctomycetota bacterium]